MTKQEALKNHDDAYDWALANGPCDETRRVICQDAYHAYMYAYKIDKCPRDDTRTAACQDSAHAKEYARYVDKCPRDDTRTAACKNSRHAYEYARYVDKCPRDDTRTAACQNSYYAYLYARGIDKCYHPETADAVRGTSVEQDYNTNICQIPPAGPKPVVKMNYESDGNSTKARETVEDPNEGKIRNPMTGEWKWL